MMSVWPTPSRGELLCRRFRHPQAAACRSWQLARSSVQKAREEFSGTQGGGSQHNGKNHDVRRLAVSPVAVRWARFVSAVDTAHTLRTRSIHAPHTRRTRPGDAPGTLRTCNSLRRWSISRISVLAAVALPAGPPPTCRCSDSGPLGGGRASAFVWPTGAAEDAITAFFMMPADPWFSAIPEEARDGCCSFPRTLVAEPPFKLLLESVKTKPVLVPCRSTQ